MASSCAANAALSSVEFKQQIRSSAISFLSFLNKSVTPFHAVESCKRILKEAGFVELFEPQKFNIQPKGKYYIKKNETSIFAFAVGGAFKPAEVGCGCSILVAHTDSPCLRIKPISKKSSEQFLQVGVAPYGGGIWRTWFDRDLSIAGQVVFRAAGDQIRHKLVNLDRPLLYIPNLAIHLDPERSKFEFNLEQHLRPILAHCSPNGCGDVLKEQEEEKSTDGGDKKGVEVENGKAPEKKPKKTNCCIVGQHHGILLQAVADLAGCTVDDLLDMDLYLYDAQPANLTGLNEEFISGARLDNLVGTYTSVMGLVNSLGNEQAFAADPNVRLVACFDNEEVGSGSAQGAESHFMEWLLRRILATPDDPTAFERAIGCSLMVSADQAHACHPNYAQKHEDCHKPGFHQGVVVKVNANQRYATTALTHAILKVIADSAGVPLQKVVVRNDSPCGSTVGPILASKLGMQTIDVGCPQLAMHSIRELGDTSSIHYATTLFSEFFNKLPSVLQGVKIEQE